MQSNPIQSMAASCRPYLSPFPISISNLNSKPSPSPFHRFIKNNNHILLIRRALSTSPGAAALKQTPQRRDTGNKLEEDTDDIALLNERIRRHHVTREVSGTALDEDDADKYISLVKEQQQRGLHKLKGDRIGEDGVAVGGFNYRVDPYSLVSGDFIVHKKVGIGRFVGIKFDVPKDGLQPVEYVFIEYADGMAKLPLKQASRMLYRYNLPNETKKPRTLSKLGNTSVWEKRRKKGKVAVQRMVVDLMELYLHRLKQKRSPYLKSPALAEFTVQFP